MTDVIKSNICTNLEESDKQNCIQKYFQMLRLPDHTFLLPLLKSDTEKHNTNVIYDYDEYDPCQWLHVILLLVDNLCVVEYKDTDNLRVWCKECIESLLKSAVVDSVSRRTALYLMKGIIENQLECKIDVLIQSPVFRKVNVNDIICVIKDSKKYNLYKLVLDQLSLSDIEVLHCIQHIIIDESTQIGLDFNAENDPVTAILSSRRVTIRSSRIFSEIIKTIVTHDSKYSYSRVLCALSMDSAAVFSTVAIGEILVETLKQREKCIESDVCVKQKQLLELKHSCTLILLSKLMEIVYDENTQSATMTTVTNVDHDSEYCLHIHGCPVINIGITLDQSGQTYSLSVSSVLSQYSEEDSVKALINLISVDDCGSKQMLRMLLDSLTMPLSDENVCALLRAIVDRELKLLTTKDLINEYEQPSLSTSKLKTVLDSKHGVPTLPESLVINIVESMIVQYVDSYEAMHLMLDRKLTSSIDYSTLCRLFKRSINTPFIATTDYLQLFQSKSQVVSLISTDGLEYLSDCFESIGDQSDTPIIILNLLEGDATRQAMLYDVFIAITKTEKVGNSATLDCLSQIKHILTEENVFYATCQSSFIIQIN